MDEASLKIAQILQELEMLRSEIDLVLSYTKGMWGTGADKGNLHFPNTIYGFLMVAMAKVDYMSQHWIRKCAKIGWRRKQTEGMIDFMHRYVGYDKEASKIAVQFFRHKLMHTSNVTKIHDKKGNTYSWLLHHGNGPDLDRDKHMVLREHQLNFGLLYFVDDLISAVPKLEEAIRKDPEILHGWEGIESEIRSFKKKF